MRERFPAVSNILTAVSNMDVADLATYMVFPLKKVAGTSNMDSYVTVFVPAFRPAEELRTELGCRSYMLGTLVFGSAYQAGGDFDHLVIGYNFTIPSVMLKTETTEPFIVCTCRTFRCGNRGGNPRPVDGSVVFYMKPSLLLKRNRALVGTYFDTRRKFAF